MLRIEILIKEKINENNKIIKDLWAWITKFRTSNKFKELYKKSMFNN